MEQFTYGFKDHSYRAAGQQPGIQKLVERFYQVMAEEESFSEIRRMHPKDLSQSIDKLWRFLCGWLGGPKLFQEKYGSIRIPMVHLPFKIEDRHRQQWLRCMERALGDQPYQQDFKS